MLDSVGTLQHVFNIQNNDSVTSTATVMKPLHGGHKYHTSEMQRRGHKQAQTNQPSQEHCVELQLEDGVALHLQHTH